MGILSWLFKTVVLDFLWEKGVLVVTWIISFFRERSIRDVIANKNKAQAKKVRTAAEEIKLLLKEGKPVPPELKEKLREESRNLIRGSLIQRL